MFWLLLINSTNRNNGKIILTPLFFHETRLDVKSSSAAAEASIRSVGKKVAFFEMGTLTLIWTKSKVHSEHRVEIGL